MYIYVCAAVAVAVIFYPPFFFRDADFSGPYIRCRAGGGILDTPPPPAYPPVLVAPVVERKGVLFSVVKMGFSKA